MLDAFGLISPRSPFRSAALFFHQSNKGEWDIIYICFTVDWASTRSKVGTNEVKVAISIATSTNFFVVVAFMNEFFFPLFLHILPCSTLKHTPVSKESRCENRFYKYHHHTEHNMFWFFLVLVSNISFHFDFSWIVFHFFFFALYISNFDCVLLSVCRIEKKKNVAKTFPRCNICHVLYPVNWRFSIVIEPFFFSLSRSPISNQCVFTWFRLVLLFSSFFPSTLHHFICFAFWNLFIYMKMT